MTESARASRLLQAQMAVLHRNLIAVLVGNLIASSAVMLVTAETGSIPRTRVWIWFASTLLLTAARAVEWLRLRGRPSADAARLARRFVVGAGVSGCVWGSLGLIAFVSADRETIIFVTLVLGGMTAGAVASLSAYSSAYWAYAIPTVTPLIVRFALEGDPFSVTCAFLAAIFLIVNLGYSKTYEATLKTSIGLRFENEELVRTLSAEKQRADLASRAKSRFLASTSHDLRQPVHAAGLLLETLQRSTSSPRNKALAAGIASALRGLDDLLVSFLDISKIEADVVRPSPNSFPLADIFASLANEFAPEAHAKGLRFRVVGTGTIVHADAALLTRILRNLIANAIRYTPAGAVLVGCRRLRDPSGLVSARIEVRDSGIGIAAERQGDIFREFYRIDEGETDPRKGHGLGLAIVAGLAQSLGATVSVRSAPGRGSTFSVIVRTGRLEPAQAAPQAPPAFRLRGRHILVADDDPRILGPMRDLLEQWGCSVTAAATIEAALDMVADMADPPDAILSDFRLANGEKGTNLIDAVERRFGGTIPAALITGDTSARDLTEIGVGDRPVLHKPVSPSRLRSALAALLEPAPR